MSQNNWETQPRKLNGEFTFRNLSNIKKKMLSKAVYNGINAFRKKYYKGGKYGDLRKLTAGNSLLEIHHMPAASTTNLSRWYGPCIIMYKDDHKKTASYGNSKLAAQYRAKQRALILNGKFLEAEQMDIRNIRNTFGTKYDSAIKEKLIYEKKLEDEGKINA